MRRPFIEEPKYEYRVQVTPMGEEVFVHPDLVNVNPKAVGCSSMWEGTVPASFTVREPCWLWRVLFRSTFEKRLERAKARAQAWCGRRNGLNDAARARMARAEDG